MNNAPIGIFDSGSGGLTVLRSCRVLLPQEDFVYVSDSRAGGWGNLSERSICAREKACVRALIVRGCKAVVAACNTATAAGIAELRRLYDLPIVGLEPAVRPAVRAYPNGRVWVLCTPATARQPKFRALLADCGGDVTVYPQPYWAQQIEQNLYSLDALRGEVASIFAAEKPDAVVLGCTHYVFVRYIFEEILGAAHVFDGNDGAARRLKSLLTERDLCASGKEEGRVVYEKI